MTTHKNHYVPQWYQKPFIRDPKGRLFYLDLNPSLDLLPSGREAGPPALQRNSPVRCFWSQDLYTTVFADYENDEIERRLFGDIDNDGAKALRAVVGGDFQQIHALFNRFFEYMDAQKIRTPKGLDWIRTRYPRLNQLELMLEMQFLRQMHITMWLEAVREIVSAEDSAVKFIITDHPVTIYHGDCPPDSTSCAYPNDPDIALKGSQTIFPLGPDHCLVLTNLEYAKDENLADLLSPRQNARNFGTTMTRVDAWIRRRKLRAEEVVAINHILKARARRYIAAGQEEWLYPERTAPRDWKECGKVLRPPKDELWHFGGETYIGYKDGRSGYQDAYGRTSKSHEYLRKDPPKGAPVATNGCPCGSGRDFGDCCRDVVQDDRMPTNVFSIRERNLMFMHAVESILGLDKGKTWEDVRRELSSEQVKEIHLAYGSLWPSDTNVADILPRPDARVSRAVYVGLVDPRTIGHAVIGWLPYFDEILLLNPFVNPSGMRPEYSPVDSPNQYKEQTIKNVALMEILTPFIAAGIVHLIPDPLELNHTMRQMVWANTRERMKQVRLTEEDLAVGRALGRDDFMRTTRRLSDDTLRHQIRRSAPELDDEKLSEVIQYMRKEHAKDPLALIQPVEPGEKGAQLQMFRGISFELALFLAQLTGAVILSDQIATANDLSAATAPSPAPNRSQAAQTVEVALGVKIVLDNMPSVTFERRDGKNSVAFRAAMRALVNAVSSGNRVDGAAIDAALMALKDGATAMMGEMDPAPSGEGDSAIFEIDAKVLVPPAGYTLNAAQRFLVAFGRRKHIAAVPLALIFGRAAATSNANAQMENR